MYAHTHTHYSEFSDYANDKIIIITEQQQLQLNNEHAIHVNMWKLLETVWIMIK